VARSRSAHPLSFAGSRSGRRPSAAPAWDGGRSPGMPERRRTRRRRSSALRRQEVPDEGSVHSAIRSRTSVPPPERAAATSWRRSPSTPPRCVAARPGSPGRASRFALLREPEETCALCASSRRGTTPRARRTSPHHVVRIAKAGVESRLTEPGEVLLGAPRSAPPNRSLRSSRPRRRPSGRRRAIGA